MRDEGWTWGQATTVCQGLINTTLLGIAPWCRGNTQFNAAFVLRETAPERWPLELASWGRFSSLQEFLDLNQTPKCTWKQISISSRCLKWVYEEGHRREIESAPAEEELTGLGPAAGRCMSLWPCCAFLLLLLCLWELSYPPRLSSESLWRQKTPVKNKFPSVDSLSPLYVGHPEWLV